MRIGDPDCWMPSEVEDPRKPKGMRHPLPAVLALSVCAMLNGARSLYAIAQWGRSTHSLPSRWGSAGSERRAWPPCITCSGAGPLGPKCLGDGEATIAIDGKAMRGMHGGELPGVRLVAKESELGLASTLLAQLELKGRVVTGDALYAQRELSLRVLERGGDYFWMLKDNQPGVR